MFNLIVKFNFSIKNSLNKFLAAAEELAVKGLSTLDGDDRRNSPTKLKLDKDEVDDCQLSSKRTSSAIKRGKRQKTSSVSNRISDNDDADSSTEVDIKRIKADPDEAVRIEENLFAEDCDEGLDQFDDDEANFDDSGTGEVGTGTSRSENRGKIFKSLHFNHREIIIYLGETFLK